MTLSRVVMSHAVSLLAFASMATAAVAAEEAAAKPNVVLILADDLGWTDLGCYGSDLYETPHIDALAAGGMKFTQNYSACTVCSPTRAALMTGKSPARLHITDWIPGMMPDNPKLFAPNWTKQLPLEEVTLAEVFRDAGYATASIGKWHLGSEPFYPEHQGFDVNLGGTEKAAPPSYLAPWRIPNFPEGQQGEYLTDRLGKAAVDYLDEVGERPFFLYLPHFAVHTPIQGRADLVKKYRAKVKPGLTHRNPVYAAMVESLDTAVGRVLSKLDELGIADRTIVIFTSDNGGRITKGTTSNAPLRFGKASAYEGGVRVPMIVHWPGVTEAGSVCETPVITMDLFPTLLEMCRLNIPTTQDGATTSPPGRLGPISSDSIEEHDVGKEDGISLTPLLQQSGAIDRDALYWHYPHHQHYQLGGAMPYSAIRSGDWKLIEFFDNDRVELYNLRDDIGETEDRAPSEPEIAAKLRSQLNDWRAEVGAQMPLPNPHYDPSKPQYDPKVKQPPIGERPSASPAAASR